MWKAPGGSLPYPSKCRVCGSSSRDCLDLGVDIVDDRLPRDLIGAILICTECMGEAAQVMGYLSAAQVEELVSKSEALIRGEYAGVESSYQRLKKIKELNDGIAAVLSNHISSDPTDVLGDRSHEPDIPVVRVPELPDIGELKPELQIDANSSATDSGSGTGDKVSDNAERQGIGAFGFEGPDDVSSGPGNDSGGIATGVEQKRERKSRKSDGPESNPDSDPPFSLNLNF